MADLTLLIVVICSFICNIYAQELPAAVNAFPSFQSLNKPGLPAPDNGQPQAYRRKPCPRRRMNDEEVLVPSPQDQPPVQNDDEYDCNIDLNAANGVSQQYATGSSTSMSLKPSIGKKVIDLLKDCADNKQNIAKDEPENVDPILLKGSRRSMGDPDNNENSINDENEELVSKAGNPGVLDVQNQGLGVGQGSIIKQDESQRVCYACSSASNPSCRAPDSRTTIKYCRQNQQCVTKSFGEDNSLTVIRDCAYSCIASSVPGVQPKYKLCKLCDDDLCNVHEVNTNGAIINNYNMLFIFVVAAIKCTI